MKLLLVLVALTLAGCGTQPHAPGSAAAPARLAAQGQAPLKDFGDATTITRKPGLTTVEGPLGTFTARAKGTTLAIAGPKGNWTVTQQGPVTTMSGPSGITTVTRNGATTVVSGPDGTTTLTQQGATTVLTGPLGTTTLTQQAGTTTMGGAGGPLTVTHDGTRTLVTGALGNISAITTGNDTTIDSPTCVGTVTTLAGQTIIQGTEFDPVPWMLWGQPANLAPWLAFAGKLDTVLIATLARVAFPDPTRRS